MRINKFLSEQGICSRREADRAIEEGRVYINESQARLGQQLEAGDELRFLSETEEEHKASYIPNSENSNKVYIALYKPKGIVCTCSAKESNNILDFVHQEAQSKNPVELPQHIYPVGRLDKESKGLIIMSNDGEFTNKLTHPSYEHEREYIVETRFKISDEFIDKIKSGLVINKFSDQEESSNQAKQKQVTTQPCFAEQLGNNRFRIVLKEGINRQIRKMCKALGNEVEELIRIRIAGLELGDLEAGNYVKIDKDQIPSLFYKS